MAMNHRKLYPSTNQTLNCQDNCDPSCPYTCYPYPDYYFFPPPPPTMAEPSKSHSVNLSPYTIVLITFTATFFLIIGYYTIFTRRCLSRRSNTPSQGEEFLDENQRPMVDNPIWYITTIGLQPSVINSITVVNYSKASGLIDGTDCSVCLNEFQEDETLRLLPKCNHAFHILCIDTWLRSHTNCPMCRCGILSNTDNNNSQSLENNSPSDHLDSNQVTEREIQEPDEELVINQSEEQNESSQIDDETKASGFWVVDIHQNNETDDIIQIHTIKRSFSMNSSMSILRLGVESEASSTKSRLYKMMSGSSISKSLHKRPVSMKRSFSYSGRSFIWRHYRNHKAMFRLRSF